MDVNWALFLIACLSINAIPGADVVYVTGKYHTGGLRAASVSAMGLAVGYYFYVFLTWAGLTAILLSLPSLFTAIQLSGALYLAWMGYSLIKSDEKQSGSPDVINDQNASTRKRSGFLGGIVISILNPKVGLFFVSFFPQFLGKNNPSYLILILGSIFCVGATFFNFLYCFLIARLNKFSPKKTHIIMGTVPGLILIGLGVYMIVGIFGNAFK